VGAHGRHSAAWIEIALGQSQSLLDAPPGSPHDHDQSPKATAVRRVAEARMTAMISSTFGRSAR